VGNHYVSDVVGGIVLGYITGRLVVNKMTPSQNDSDSPQQIVILTIGIPLESKNK
jgi:membrane-associated phospholipid phosphatase